MLRLSALLVRATCRWRSALRSDAVDTGSSYKYLAFAALSIEDVRYSCSILMLLIGEEVTIKIA
jgi:hypothetical protein